MSEDAAPDEQHFDDYFGSYQPEDFPGFEEESTEPEVYWDVEDNDYEEEEVTDEYVTLL